MSAPILPPGTLVVVGASRLGRIVKEARQGGATGYSVQVAAVEAHEGSAPHFVEGHAVRVAELGVNVCHNTRGTHWCGLLHVGAAELAWLEVRDDR